MIPRCWLLVAMALTMALGVTAKGRDQFVPMAATTLTGMTTGTITANQVTSYSLTTGQPAVEYSSIKLVVDISMKTGAAAGVIISLNFPTNTATPNLAQGSKVVVMAANAACTGTAIVLTIDSTSTATGVCTGTLKPSNTMLTGSQKWSTVKTQTPPFVSSGTFNVNEWLLIVDTGAAATTVLVNSWSIVLDTQCTILVPNSVNLATATVSGAQQSLTCSSGFTATTTTLTCGTSGFTPAACINGGGAVITWGLNANPVNPGVVVLPLVITLNLLGRAIPAPTAVHFDPALGYMWLPNGVFATRVALADLCTIVLSSAGVVYQWGYCGTPDNTVLLSTTSNTVSAQIVNMPGGAAATMIWATHFTFAALTPGNQLIMWGVLTSATGAWNVMPVSDPEADWFCGFTWQATPTAVAGLPGSGISDVALAMNRVAIVTTAGEVYAWGCNAYFSLGSTYVGASVTTTSQIVVATPTKVTSTSLPSTVTRVAMGEYQTIALAAGAIYAWGVTPQTYLWSNFNLGGIVPSPDPANLGTAAAVKLTATNFLAPTSVDSTRTYTQIAANRWTFAGLTSAGAIYTWGYDYYPAQLQVIGGVFAIPAVVSYVGILGRGTVAAGYDNAIGAVTFGATARTISTIALGTTFGVAIDTSGNVVQWGNQFIDTQLTTSLWQWSAGSATPKQLTFPSGDNAMWVAAGRDTAAVLDARNGAASCPAVGGLLTSQDVAFVSKMSSNNRAKLVAAITSISICGSTNWVNSFLNVALVTAPYVLTMPSFSNGVTITITKFNKVSFMVASTYSPTGASIAAVGIVPAQGRQLLFLFQIDQMYLDSSMFSGNPLVVQVVVSNLAIVYVYNDGYRNGKQLTGAEGSLTNSGTTYTLSLAHTSAVAGYGPYDSGDGSNEALLGLLGLIALPVICALGLYIWLWYRYTHTEAVVEAANPVAPVFMMEPQPVVAPSPAYIPAAYPAAPAYYV